MALEVQDGRTPAKITASGRGLLAEQILQVAFANGVKVREDADLVQILSAVGVDSNIPTEAFAAVAEVLSYVYRANGQVPPPDFAELGSASGEIKPKMKRRLLPLGPRVSTLIC